MYTVNLDNTYYTTGAKYNGISYSGKSDKNKHHCLISKIGERISLVPMMEVARLRTFK